MSSNTNNMHTNNMHTNKKNKINTIDTKNYTTYYKPVPDTIPLYFHKKGTGNIFPSFDSKPPNSDPGWTQLDISPIFVLPDIPIKDFKFKCVNGKCIPKLKSTENVYQYVQY